MLTQFGKALRKLRIDRNELLRDMAEILHVTPSYLSAIENGKRNIPEEWPDVIAEKYSLSSVEYSQLLNAASYSKEEIRLNVKNSHNSKKELALSFARKFDELSEEDIQRLLAALNS